MWGCVQRTHPHIYPSLLGKYLFAVKSPVLLTDVTQSKEKGGGIGRVHHKIQALILKALAFKACGDMLKAADGLGQALWLAEPSNYMRVFMDEGTPLVDLLKKFQVSRFILKEKCSVGRRIILINSFSPGKMNEAIPEGNPCWLSP